MPNPTPPSAIELLVAMGYLSDDGARLGTLSPADALDLSSRLTAAVAVELSS